MDKWNQLIAERNGSFLQSSEWGELQNALGRYVGRFWDNGAPSLLISYRLPLDRRYLYAPRGPVLDPSRDYPKTLQNYLKELKSNVSAQIAFLRIEPPIEDSPEARLALKAEGLIQSPSAQPETTRLIDLKKPIAEIHSDMQYETRYAIRAAERRGVKIIKAYGAGEKHKAFKAFWTIFEETNKRHRLKAYPKRYYEAVAALKGDCRAEIFEARLQEETISAAIFVFFGKTCVYLYSASRAGYGKYNAPTLLLWEAIKEAKTGGCEVFDFWGVSRENKRWAGITAFKESFGGREFRYAGTWDYVFDKKFYELYKIFKRVAS